MNEFTLRFLVVGGIIAVLISFGVWWFFVHNSTDKIAEQAGYTFYKSVEYVCETGDEKEMKFELQQGIIASLKDEVENGINWVKKKLGIGGPELEIPIQLFNDPYYKIYWESFPPEPPYQFGWDALGTAASIFAPWSEDLPWTSNFLATVAMDTFTLGIDFFGLKEIKEFGGNVAGSFYNKIKSISPESFEKLQSIWNALDKGANLVIDKLGKATHLTFVSGKFLISEGKFVGKVTFAYTAFCLVTQDKTLGDCLKEGVVLGIGADVAKIVTQKFVIPKVNSYVKNEIAEVKKGFSTKVNQIKDALSSYFDDEVAESTDFKDLIKQKGWVYDSTLQKWRVSRDLGDDVIENIINPLEEWAKENGWPTSTEGFTMIYDFDNQGRVTGIKDVIWDQKGFLGAMKDKIALPFTEKIGQLEETVMSDTVLDSDGFVAISRDSKYLFESDPEKAKELLRLAGVDIKDSDKALRLVSTKLAQLEGEAKDGLFFVVTEKGSKLDTMIGKIDDAYKTITPTQIPQDEYRIVKEYLNNILDQQDSDEAKRLWDLLSGKRLRLKEDAEIFSRGNFGYMIMRIQDLYTPLGATYWDRYFSYYGYQSKESLPEGYCQTSCGDGKICIQLGACVRRYDLPDACKNKGIDSIKLKRGSLVAADPRFYLVSPCYSELKIYASGDTIFVEPSMPINYDKKNYCYASSGLVNWYVGTEAGSYLVRCVSAAACAITATAATTGVAAPTLIDAITACFGFGQKFTGGCSIISNFAGLLVDIFRETQLVYPDAYRNNPGLIDFKIPSLN